MKVVVGGGCPRVFCSVCTEEMIHRDNRHWYESASGFGQIVSRDGPRTFTVGDIDLYHWKRLAAAHILRLLEHKQPGQPLKPMQAKVLRFLEAVIAHAIECDRSPLQLHSTSGVYLLRGVIEAEANGRHKTQLGPQSAWNPRSGRLEFPDQASVFAWLNGEPQ